jgi:hypothetical protein
MPMTRWWWMCVPPIIPRSTRFCLVAMEALTLLYHAGCPTSAYLASTWQLFVASDTSVLLSLNLSYNPLLLSTYNEL